MTSPDDVELYVLDGDDVVVVFESFGFGLGAVDEFSRLDAGIVGEMLVSLIDSGVFCLSFGEEALIF